LNKLSFPSFDQKTENQFLYLKRKLRNEEGNKRPWRSWKVTEIFFKLPRQLSLPGSTSREISEEDNIPEVK
jgi:hypothetical protein